jgi:hemolysin activation/secretion protein
MAIQNKTQTFHYYIALVLGCMAVLFSSVEGNCQSTDPGILERQLRESRPEFAPPPLEVVPDIKVEDSRELVDAGAGPKFFVREIKITGNTLISIEELAEFVEVGEGEDMTLGILTLYSNEVTAAYASQGYFLARAFIPAQEIKDGVVIMQVVEGKLGRIKIAGNKTIASKQFTERMVSLRDEEVLNESALERVLLELNSLMGVQVKSVLRPGELPGTTDLVLQVNETRPYTVSLDADNFGSKFTGRIRVGATATVGNLFNLGDQFSFRVVQSDLGQDFFNPSFLFPITNRGTTLKFSFVHSEHDLGEELAINNIGGSSQIFSAEARHPLHRSRKGHLFVKGGIEARNYTNKRTEVKTSDDRLFDIYLGVGGNFSDPYKGRNFFDAQAKTGFTETDTGGHLNSRTKGQGDVTIFNSSLTRYQNASILHKKIPGFFIMKAGGQFASARVLSPDQTAIGGMGTVRGYPISETSGDHGYTFSLEYNMPWPGKFPHFKEGWPSLDKIVTLLAFIDHGKVFVEDNEPGERHRALTGAGMGFKINVPKKDEASLATSFSLVWGVPVMENAGGSRPSDGSYGTLYLSGLVTF